MFLQAQRPDEMKIAEGEDLEVIEWDDGDGWTKGRNKSGQEGYFPQSYVQPISRPPSPGITMNASSSSSDVTTPTQSTTAPQTAPAHSSPQTNGSGEQQDPLF